MSSKFNIAFLSSSDFALPVVQDIFDCSGKTLREVLEKQLKQLKVALAQSKFDLEDLDLQTFYQNILDQNLDFLEQKICLNLVISQPKKQNRQKIISNPVLEWAEKNQTKTFTPQKLNLEIETLQTLLKEITDRKSLDIAITASYGQIISQEILRLPKYGFINWHPSKLPLYRGATPMQTLLKDGKNETALSWIEMTKEMDAGGVLLQLNKSLDDNLNFFELAQTMASFGKDTWLLAIVSQIMKNFQFIQDSKDVTFCKMLNKQDRFVDPKIQNAKQIFNHFRAYIAFPKTNFLDKNVFLGEIKILECKFVKDFKPIKIEEINDKTNFENDLWLQFSENKKLKTFLKCANQTYLEINKIGLANGKNIDFSGYLMK